MRQSIFNRTELLLGRENMEKLQNTGVILFGVGGVGSWCAESLVRSGIGNLTIVDSDRICITNVNRQMQATSQTVGKVKVDTLKKRLVEINPHARINAQQKIYNEENSASFELESYDFIIDAIDSLTNKVHLIEKAVGEKGTLFSSMGAALKIDPSRVKVDNIWKTHRCPLAREVRSALRKRKIQNDFLCVYSDEKLTQHGEDTNCGTSECLCPKTENGPGDSELVNHEWCSQKVQINGSIAHITAIFGFTLAGLVIQSVVGEKS
ncbi:ThiF family adenylyltransferase [Spirochaetota bacterium]